MSSRAEKRKRFREYAAQRDLEAKERERRALQDEVDRGLREVAQDLRDASRAATAEYVRLLSRFQAAQAGLL